MPAIVHSIARGVLTEIDDVLTEEREHMRRV